METAESRVISTSISYRLKEYATLAKLRLSSLVILSSVLGYGIGFTTFSWLDVFVLALGGLLVTASSNGFNQILERSYDGLMDRTKDRPMVSGSLNVSEAVVVMSVLGLTGVLTLGFYFTTLCGTLAFLALFSYVAIYTPLKRYSPWAVFVGAFPGAIPPMLGWVAAKGFFGLEAGLLFLIQFIWQFPHFWAIALKVDEDYKRAGFKMLPHPEKYHWLNTFLVLLSALLLVLSGYLPYHYGFLSIGGLILLTISGLSILYFASKMVVHKTSKAELNLMFASLIYLPLSLMLWMLL